MKSMLTAGLGAIAICCIAPSAPAQNQAPSQEKLVEMRAEKMAKPVFKLAAWTFDYDAARARAEKEGKLLFVYFTRSYAH